MLIVLNGYPGVGKLTIGQALAPLIGAKLLDIHSVYNVAFALTDFKSDAFYETIRSVQEIADRRIFDLPAGVPVVLTEILTEGPAWSDECLQRLLELGRKRGPILMVHLHCDLQENKRRIMGQSRKGARKPLDPDMAERNQTGGAVLVGADWPHFLSLDVTSLSAEAAANRIAEWSESVTTTI